MGRPNGTVPTCWRGSTRRSAARRTWRVITADGTLSAYAGNTENPVFTFRLGRIGLACTGIYSLDRSLFRFVATGATDRRLIRIGGTVTLNRHGIAVGAS